MANKELIWVQAGPETGEGRVAIMENHEMHPGGTAFVFDGGEPQQVWPTREVNFRLREEFLEELRNYNPDAPVAASDSSEEEEDSNENPPASFSGTSDKTADGQMESTTRLMAPPTETAAQRKAREKAEARDRE